MAAPTASRADATLQALEADGYAVWHGWVDDAPLVRLRDEAHHLLETLERDEYPYGRRAKLVTAELCGRAPASRSLLLEGPIDAVCEAYGARTDERLCWTEETEPDAGRGPGRPHVGPTRQLKVIVYLTDVLSGSGPFRVLPTGREAVEQRWLATWRHLLGLSGEVADIDVYRRAADYADSQDAALLDADASPAEPIDPTALHPVIALAGSVVFFDTQVLHCGGAIQPGGHRLTARRHCELVVP